MSFNINNDGNFSSLVSHNSNVYGTLYGTVVSAGVKFGTSVTHTIAVSGVGSTLENPIDMESYKINEFHKILDSGSAVEGFIQLPSTAEIGAQYYVVNYLEEEKCLTVLSASGETIIDDTGSSVTEDPIPNGIAYWYVKISETVWEAL